MVGENLTDELRIKAMCDKIGKVRLEDQMKKLNRINKFLDNIDIEFRDDNGERCLKTTTSKRTFESMIPEFFDDTQTKINYLAKMPDRISYHHVMEFLRCTQTCNDEFLYYPVLVDYYHLQLDSNNMIIFTDKNGAFPVEDIKQETLTTWYSYKTANFVLGDFQELGQMICQGKIELSLFASTSNKRYDELFYILGLLIECDEKQHTKEAEILNDQYKNIIGRFCGYKVIRLKFYEIFDDAKQRKIPIHVAIRDSPIIACFKKEIEEWVFASSMRFQKSRDLFLMESLKARFMERLNYKQKYINELQCEIAQIENQKEKDQIQEQLDIASTRFDVFRKSSNDIADNTSLISMMFELKYRSKQVDIPCINFSEACNIFSINNSNKPQFKIFLREEFNIRQFNIDNLSWSNLLECSLRFKFGSDSFREIIGLYLLVIQENYEKIINSINSFYEEIIGSQEDFNQFGRAINQKVGKQVIKLQEKNKKLESKNSELKNTNDNLTKEIAELKKMDNESDVEVESTEEAVRDPEVVPPYVKPIRNIYMSQYMTDAQFKVIMREFAEKARMNKLWIKEYKESQQLIKSAADKAKAEIDQGATKAEDEFVDDFDEE